MNADGFQNTLEQQLGVQLSPELIADYDLAINNIKTETGRSVFNSQSAFTPREVIAEVKEISRRSGLAIVDVIKYIATHSYDESQAYFASEIRQFQDYLAIHPFARAS